MGTWTKISGLDDLSTVVPGVKLRAWFNLIAFGECLKNLNTADMENRSQPGNLSTEMTLNLKASAKS